MTLTSFLALLPLLVGILGPQDDPSGDDRATVTRHVVEEQWIVRVPVRARPALQKFDWKEQKGFKCMPADDVRGAVLSGADQVDFLLPNRERVRAKFDGNCPALDFYGGFYLKTSDDRVCARRDSVHSRMGGSCRIERFRRLVPKLKD